VVAVTGDGRRERLLELIRHTGFASLRQLKSETGVSESTIRRDLDHLEETGVVKRSHGGVFYTGPSPELPHFDQRQAMHWDKKRAIAAAVAPRIEDGDTILLDGGSTTYELARLLVGRPLTVVTNSLPVANLFASSPESELILIGGYVHTATGVSLGQYADEMLSRLNARPAVLSVAGIGGSNAPGAVGLYNSNALLVETERMMMKSSDRVIVVADSTKFGRRSLAQLCGLSDINTLVVDDDIDTHWRQQVTGAGVELVIAPTPQIKPDGSGEPSR